MEFERIIQIQPPFDKRHADPNKNYGIHGMTLRFVLKGPLGATQFVFYTGQYLRHVSDELFFKPRVRDHNPFKGMGADIGFHSYKPHYEGHTPMEGTCDILGCRCYYDGSSLQASEFEQEFLERGTDAVWPMLEERYRSWFAAPQADRKGESGSGVSVDRPSEAPSPAGSAPDVAAMVKRLRYIADTDDARLYELSKLPAAEAEG